MKNIILFILFFFSARFAGAQGCTTPGQNPATAFPVCGTSVFTQSNVPLCGGRSLPSPKCPGDPLTDVNPFYYKFTAFESGTLGFEITPKTLADDYDWELYDITGHDPNDIFSDGSLVVASNWSGEGGKTGASRTGTKLFECAGMGKPLWSKMPELQKGHNYLLLVSHFTQSQSGYTLEFKGGTAVITDPLPPALKSATANCGGDVVWLRLNKKLRCNSISANGSEFFITPADATITASSSVACTSRFETDSIEIKFNRALAPGKYKLGIKNGSDGNTLLDFCDNAVPDTDEVAFEILPSAPSTMDSLVAPTCAPNSLLLVFPKPIACNSIAPNGSDFEVAGPYAVSVSGAKGVCSGGYTTAVEVQLNKRLEKAGTFLIRLKQGTDGNTLEDECHLEVPAGSSLSFEIKDTVDARFTHSVTYSCDEDVIAFQHPGGNGVNQWQWNLDDNQTSNQQNPIGRYSLFDTKNISLKVSNGFCTDSATAAIVLDNFLTVDFTTYEEECPQEPVPFVSNATGRIIRHDWSFGDGGTSTEVSPTHAFQQPQRTTAYQVRYSVTDEFGCTRSITKPITIYSSCTLYMPTGFTPNGDGKNDVFRPLNVVKAEQFEFRVFNRWGQQVFATSNPSFGWNGTVNGKPQDTGAYVWMLRYTNRITKKVVERKGSFMLIR